MGRLCTRSRPTLPLVHPSPVFVIKKKKTPLTPYILCGVIFFLRDGGLPHILCGVIFLRDGGRGYGNPTLDGPNERNFDGANDCPLPWSPTLMDDVTLLW